MDIPLIYIQHIFVSGNTTWNKGYKMKHASEHTYFNQAVNMYIM